MTPTSVGSMPWGLPVIGADPRVYEAFRPAPPLFWEGARRQTASLQRRGVEVEPVMTAVTIPVELPLGVILSLKKRHQLYATGEAVHAGEGG